MYDVLKHDLIFLRIYTTRWCVLCFVVYGRRDIKKGTVALVQEHKRKYKLSLSY